MTPFEHNQPDPEQELRLVEVHPDTSDSDLNMIAGLIFSGIFNGIVTDEATNIKVLDKCKVIELMSET